MNIAIVGYGRLGRAAEIMAEHFDGVRVVGVFSRRSGDEVKTAGAQVYPEGSIGDFPDIDCALICHGSSRDTPTVTPRIAELVSTVDSYDLHGNIARHRAAVDRAARLGGNVSLVSVGWDPGLLSLIRILAAAFMPYGVVNTFWGPGVSQGHSEAIRGIGGVRCAVQYTEPRSDALTLAEAGVRLSDTDRHRRVCYIACERGEEKRIDGEVRALEGYFRGYETEVRFITEEELVREHQGLAHSGRVLSVGRSGAYGENRSRLDFSLTLSSNPEFTAGVMLSAALATLRMRSEGRVGAYTLADVPLSYLLPRGRSELDYL